MKLPPINWKIPSQLQFPSSGELHLWLIRLKAAGPEIDIAATALDEGEKERAARFYFDQDRVRFILAHSALRRILSRYLSTTPEMLQFTTSKNGKPELARNYGGGELRFNLSHAGNLGLIGVTGSARVGVDVEMVRGDFDLVSLARRFFTAEETDRLQALTLQEQPNAFFVAWTQKEAYLKATGSGLSGGLDKVRSDLIFSGPPRLQSFSDESTRWSLLSFSIDGRVPAAAVVEGGLEQVEWYALDQAGSNP